ncbi:MAG: hypothetical protein IPJ81_16980 [Chitinophagaceae bacterium]|nr:hypothetical protein [Chitinophagaceae bacterium]
MKKTIQLSKKELITIVWQIDCKFREHEGPSPGIKWNSYLGNYEILAASVFRVTSQLGLPKNVGSRPLRDILYYQLVDKSYQLYFIDACYLYIHGTIRQEYLEKANPCEYQMSSPLMISMFEVADKLYVHGNAKEAKEILQPLFYNAKKYNLPKTNLKLYAGICLAFGKVKMQLGDKEKTGGALNLALCALESFLELKEQKGITESYQLLGIIYRQMEQFTIAIQYYEKVLDLTKNDNNLQFRNYHTMHDLAVSHFLLAEKTGNSNFFTHSSVAFQISNNYFYSWNRIFIHSIYQVSRISYQTGAISTGSPIA